MCLLRYHFYKLIFLYLFMALLNIIGGKGAISNINHYHYYHYHYQYVTFSVENVLPYLICG